MSTKVEATIEDLMPAPGKAEIINGEIVHMSPTGGLPRLAGGAIFRSLDDYRRRTGRGYALPDNALSRLICRTARRSAPTPHTIRAR